MRFSKYRGSSVRFALRASKFFRNSMVRSGLAPWSQPRRERRMSLMPKAAPALISRLRNSTRRKAPSTCSSSMPRSASRRRTLKTRSSMSFRFAGEVPRSPAEKVSSRVSVSIPVAGERSSPRPDSTSSFWRGEPAFPRSTSERISKARTLRGSVTEKRSQFTVTELAPSLGLAFAGGVGFFPGIAAPSTAS